METAPEQLDMSEDAIYQRIVAEGLERTRRHVHINPGQLEAQGFTGAQVGQHLRSLYGPAMKPFDSPPTQ